MAQLAEQQAWTSLSIILWACLHLPSVYADCQASPNTRIVKGEITLRGGIDPSFATKPVLWSAAPFPGAPSYRDVTIVEDPWIGDATECCNWCCEVGCGVAFFSNEYKACGLMLFDAKTEPGGTGTILSGCAFNSTAARPPPAPYPPGVFFAAAPPPPSPAHQTPVEPSPPAAGDSSTTDAGTRGTDAASSSTDTASSNGILNGPGTNTDRSSPSTQRTGIIVGSVIGAAAALALCAGVAVIGLRSRRHRAAGMADLRAPDAKSGDDFDVVISGKGKGGGHEAPTLPLPFGSEAVLDTLGGIDVPKGLGLFDRTFDNPSQIAAKKLQIQEAISSGSNSVEAALHFIAKSNGGQFDSKYQIDAHARHIAGGQATVVMATSMYTGMEFAIKFFSDHAVFLQESEVYKFLFKVDPVASSFVHDIRDKSDVELENGVKMPSYIVMKRGMSMQDWVRNRRPPPLMGIWMLSEVFQQVALLHGNDWVHRDLKPANVIWVPDDNAWHVIDYGCAAKEGSRVPRAFTLRYAPPEAVAALQAKQATIIAQKSMDVWALGVLAFEMLSGELLYPFGTPSSEMSAMLMGQKPFLYEERPEVWQKVGKLRTAVQAMLSRDPAQRPSVRAISEQLKHLAMTTGATLTTAAASSQLERSKLEMTSTVLSSSVDKSSMLPDNI